MRIVSIAALSFVLSVAAFAVDLGKPSPAFTIQQLNGKPTLSLTQFKGKVVALALMDTECPHCQNLTQILNGVSKEYAAKGVQVVGCYFNDAAPQILPSFIQRFQPVFPVGYSNGSAVRQYLSWSELKPLYVPHMVFLDRRGVVRADIAGENDFMRDPATNVRKQLDEMLKPASTTRTRKPQPATKSTASVAVPSHP